MYDVNYISGPYCCQTIGLSSSVEEDNQSGVPFLTTATEVELNEQVSFSVFGFTGRAAWGAELFDSSSALSTSMWAMTATFMVMALK